VINDYRRQQPLLSTRDFVWEGNAKPKIALGNLQRPAIEEGGLNLLVIKARNDAIELAIEIMWLKTYLDLAVTMRSTGYGWKSWRPGHESYCQ
jgi:hypothetical protein